MDEIISFLNDYCCLDFWNYISDKVIVIPSGSDMCFYGCYPIVSDDILVSIRVCVPEIVTFKDILINIHEFAHAIDLYNEIGCVYYDNRDEREAFAKKLEKEYINNNI